MTTVQQKIKFLLCQNPTFGVDERFILQATDKQFMYQIIAFDAQEQYLAFQSATQERYIKLEGYRIVIRMSCALQQIDVNQDTARGVLEESRRVMGEALDWYSGHYVTGKEEMNPYKETTPP